MPALAKAELERIHNPPTPDETFRLGNVVQEMIKLCSTEAKQRAAAPKPYDCPSHL